MPIEWLEQSWEEWLRDTFGAEADFFPVDMGEVLAGDLSPARPSLLRRSDGHHLLYPGKLHWVASEPEAGKTWLALVAAAECLRDGRKVVYFDYEMSPQDAARRLLLLGVPQSAVAGHLVYIRPPGRISDEMLVFYGQGDEASGDPGLLEGAALVVFDACTEAMVADGLDPLSNADVAAWLQRAPALARRVGAAVLVLDHVVKDREARGRWAIGGQHKLAQADVSYSLYNVQPLAPGAVGVSAIAVHKDRPGGVRQHAADRRKAGTLVVNAEDPENLEGFVAEASEEDEGPTERMEKILQVARGSEVPLSKNQLESVGGGRGSTNRNAVTRLIATRQLVPHPEDVERGARYPRYVAAPEEADGDGVG